MADRVTLDSPALAGSVRKSASASRETSSRPSRRPRTRLSDYERRPVSTPPRRAVVQNQTIAPRVEIQIKPDAQTPPPVPVAAPEPRSRPEEIPQQDFEPPFEPAETDATALRFISNPL